MSFDLLFCAPLGTKFDVSLAQQFMRDLPHVVESGSDDGYLIQFTYENEGTGVYCTFDLGGEPDEEDMEFPDGYADLGFSVNVNFLRPHFFALEVMPLVARIANSFDLSIYDPQEDQIYPPQTPSGTLALNWIDHNRRATKSVAQGDDPIRKPYLPAEKSLYWWQYMYPREDYQNSLAEDVFVPSIMLMVDDQQRVISVVLWSAELEDGTLVALPQMFPLCDYLLLAWKEREATSFEKALVPFALAMESLASVLSDVDRAPVEGLKVLLPNQQSRASQLYQRLSKQPFEGLTPIAQDGFVDVEVD